MLPPEPLAVIIRMAKSATALRFRTCGRLYLCDTFLERRAQDLEHLTAELRPFIQEEDAVVGQRHVARHRHVTPTDQPDVREGMLGGRHGRVVTTAVRSPVRPATRWMRVVSRASARVMAGKIVVSRRASIDLPAPGGPSRRTLWAERLHTISLHPCLSGPRWSRC